LGHRIFARYVNGHTIHGHVRDFQPATGIIRIAKSASAAPDAHRLDQIETVVFVGDVDPSRPDWRAGPQPFMHVELPSGEAVGGRCLATVPGVGFWLAPDESDCEDVRMFVPQRAPIRFSFRPELPTRAASVPPVVRGVPVTEMPGWSQETPSTYHGLIPSDDTSTSTVRMNPPPPAETARSDYWQRDTLKDLGEPDDAEEWAKTKPEPFRAVRLDPELCRAATHLQRSQA